METASASEYQSIHSRFTDVSNEPMRQLPPIKGYENMPLVSLEKAVEPISHFFDSINDYVRVAKTNCTHPRDNLSQDESASIYLYTMEFSSGPSFYTILNSTLRAEQRRDIKRWFLYLKLFCTALRKIPSENMRVWRGVSGIDLRSKYELEKEIFWWGVSSCAKSMSALIENEHLKQHGLRTVFDINCFNAKNVVSHSHYPNEKELILMPGSCFKVMDISEPHPKLYFINLEQTQSEYSMIESPFPKMTGMNKYYVIKLLSTEREKQDTVSYFRPKLHFSNEIKLYQYHCSSTPCCPV